MRKTRVIRTASAVVWAEARPNLAGWCALGYTGAPRWPVCVTTREGRAIHTLALLPEAGSPGSLARGSPARIRRPRERACLRGARGWAPHQSPPPSRSPGLGSGPRSQADAGLPLRPGPGVGEDGGQWKRPGEGQSRGRELGALRQPPCPVGNSWETQRPAWKLPI